MKQSIDPANILLQGGIGVLATDTLYGLVARAEDPVAVERLYSLKQRRPDKPLIILIASISEVQRFQVEINDVLRQQLKEYWPGRVSIILNCNGPQWHYLHRGTNTLAFRVPAKESLRNFLRRTGPLVAPSANPEGMPPARTLAEARNYFGGQIEFYRRGRTIEQASRIIRIEEGNITVLR